MVCLWPDCSLECVAEMGDSEVFYSSVSTAPQRLPTVLQKQQQERFWSAGVQHFVFVYLFMRKQSKVSESILIVLL